jgi:hypothetical protein
MTESYKLEKNNKASDGIPDSKPLSIYCNLRKKK